jgi:hypothetical protein
MCLIKGAFVGEKILNAIKIHGTTIEKKLHVVSSILLTCLRMEA